LSSTLPKAKNNKLIIQNPLEALCFGVVSGHTATTACLRASCW